MAADQEPVYAPDQLKPGNRKRARRAALISAVVILLFFWGNHEGNTENVWLIIFALGLVAAVIVDAVLRRNGLKPEDQ
ncbi:DUF2631 domain-containing protein [Paractinoplanes brasiliensis]|uniref:Uncharacterized protein DUF2631 n=1 Tax=Paractinoplanes brasiliensis TaxID=52695 RepID=A0A4R6K0Q4_9ACTN|nr:DUF2631 domain-containing protein [Actinoplanes brasiliensis]TDO40725.1 uncharacterized protein DUF2631 [Actinoplanes brasiliensis]GID25796.1 hypothetical protein Abr02nite_07790 [Actinoplanes brasiliensis]